MTDWIKAGVGEYLTRVAYMIVAVIVIVGVVAFVLGAQCAGAHETRQETIFVNGQMFALEPPCEEPGQLPCYWQKSDRVWLATPKWTSDCECDVDTGYDCKTCGDDKCCTFCCDGGGR